MQIIDEVVDPQRGLRGSSSCPEEVYSAPLPVVGFVGCPELHDALAKLMNAVGGADYADGAFRILSLDYGCAFPKAKERRPSFEGYTRMPVPACTTRTHGRAPHGQPVCTRGLHTRGDGAVSKDWSWRRPLPRHSIRAGPSWVGVIAMRARVIVAAALRQLILAPKVLSRRRAETVMDTQARACVAGGARGIRRLS